MILKMYATRLGTVAHVGKHSDSGDRDLEDCGAKLAGQKVSKIPSQQVNWAFQQAN
jgi:hypothetical protein